MLKKNILLISLVTIILFQTFSSLSAYDARVVIHQNTLNKFLKVIGPISNKGKSNIIGMSINYTWLVKNPRITIDENRSFFTSDVIVDTGTSQYDTMAKGDVFVSFDEVSNNIKVDIKNVTFELYFNLLGNKIHISDMDISSYYHPSFQFAGPQPLQSSFAVKLPDGTQKNIFVKNAKNMIHMEKEQIVVDSDLIFSDKPFIAN